MAKDVTVDEGDCISKISFENGLFWETVWNHPGNAELKSLRASPFVLMEGDKVHVPDIREKTVSLSTGQTHTFKRKGVPAELKVHLYDGQDPLANQSYELEIDGKKQSGSTDGKGLVKAFLPPNAESCTITVGARVWTLGLRRLDPCTELSGVQQRLANLGYYAGAVDGKMNPDTARGIRRFQKKNGLTVTGEDAPELRDKLVELHGS